MGRLSYACLYLRNLRSVEDGQDLAEYALLIALIAVVVIGSISLLGGQAEKLFIHTVLTIERATGIATEMIG